MERDAPALLSKAVRIAASVHENQRDKSGAAYILHPLRLMSRARTDDERIVALLHDVVEDSGMFGGRRWELEDLRAEGFPDHLLQAVDRLTSREDEHYDDFISRVLEDSLAVRVKLLDIEDNMDLTRLGKLTDRDLDRLRKYHLARQRLLAARRVTDSIT